MSKDVIRINFSSMDNGADSIDAASNRLDGLLTELQQYTNRATSMWDGDSREAYLRLQREWDRAQAELISNLRRIGNAVRSSRSRFHALEARNTTAMGG